MYYYKIYGLTVQSEVELEEAYAISKTETTDVTITFEQVPEVVRQMKERKNNLRFLTNEIAFYIEKVGFFYIKDKDTIIVETEEEATFQNVKNYLLGVGFGFLLTLKNIVALHGGAVSYEGKGIIITGDSGAGKSTISDELRKQGALFVADDVSALQIQGDHLQIQMGYLQQKLCRDAALNAGYDLKELIYTDEDRDKFGVRLKSGYLLEGAPLTTIVEICLTDADEMSIEELSGQEKLQVILKNIYRANVYFRKIHMPVQYMQMCLKVASQIPIYRINRPVGIDTKEEITNWITSKVGQEKEICK